MPFTVDHSLCINCGACIPVCPSAIFSRGENGIETVSDPCLYCFHCTAACPTKAVRYNDLPESVLYPDFSAEPLLNLLQHRRSVRHYSDAVPDRDFLRSILDRAEHAPSTKNQHPVRWVVVRGADKLDKVFRLAAEWAQTAEGEELLRKRIEEGRNPITCGAPCALIACCNQDAFRAEVDSSIAATVVELQLAAAGWSTCWSGYYRRAIESSPAVREASGIPDGFDPYAILMVGKAKGERYLRPAYRKAARIDWAE